MTRHDVLAEELYSLSLSLNKFNLSFKSQRTALMRMLSAMQFLACNISMETINDEQVQKIIGALEDALHTRCFDFASNLLNADSTANPLTNQQALLLEQSSTIFLSICELCNKPKNYKETVGRYIAVLQTIPRAFLSHTHPAWLSTEDVLDAARTYLKCD